MKTPYKATVKPSTASFKLDKEKLADLRFALEGDGFALDRELTENGVPVTIVYRDEEVRRNESRSMKRKDEDLTNAPKPVVTIHYPKGTKSEMSVVASTGAYDRVKDIFEGLDSPDI